jgi:hypothetical protein
MKNFLRCCNKPMTLRSTITGRRDSASSKGRFGAGMLQIQIAAVLGLLVSSSLTRAELTGAAKTAINGQSQTALPASVAEVQRSPVEFFRELLAMTPAERKEALANRPESNRKAILAKVREYETLKPDQREWQLRATELRWYLLPLMRTDSTNRTAQLSRIPDDIRPLISDHLAQWDALPPSVQLELLRHQQTIGYLLEIGPGTNVTANLVSVTNISAPRRAMLEHGIRDWQNIPEDRRQEMMDRFRQFFELSSAEKEQSLKTLSDAERNQIEKTLRSYAKLTAAQRATCMRSFEKFASMSVLERQQFLKNAEKWKLMSPDERATWRNIVEAAPATPTSRSHLPPLPRLPHPRVAGTQTPGSAAIATNR